MDPQRLEHALSLMNARNGGNARERRETAALWREHAHAAHYPAGSTIVHTGTRAQHAYLLVSGLVRGYYTSPDGQFFNKFFALEGMFFGTPAAAFTRSTTRYAIEALQASDVLAMDLDTLDRLVKRHPALARMLRQEIRFNFIDSEEREAVLLTRDTEGRYRWLQQRHPQLLQRVPGYHLAAYLGMTPVSLSRIKHMEAPQ